MRAVSLLASCSSSPLPSRRLRRPGAGRMRPATPSGRRSTSRSPIRIRSTSRCRSPGRRSSGRSSTAPSSQRCTSTSSPRSRSRRSAAPAHSPVTTRHRRRWRRRRTRRATTGRPRARSSSTSTATTSRTTARTRRGRPRTPGTKRWASYENVCLKTKDGKFDSGRRGRSDLLAEPGRGVRRGLPRAQPEARGRDVDRLGRRRRRVLPGRDRAEAPPARTSPTRGADPRSRTYTAPSAAVPSARSPRRRRSTARSRRTSRHRRTSRCASSSSPARSASHRAPAASRSRSAASGS